MGIEIGPLHIRRSGFVDADPARVWAECATQARLAAWFGRGHTLEHFEPRVGSDVRLSVEIDGQVERFGGRLLVFEPEREITYESNWEGEDAWPATTFHTLRLTPAYSGTLVEIFHHGFERLGPDAGGALEDYEAGWSNHRLVALREIIEGAD